LLLNEGYINFIIAKDREINEETVFTQGKDYDLDISNPKGIKKLQWFPDCQRTNTSPDRIGLHNVFEEKLQPFVRQDSKKEKHDGSPVNKKFMKTVSL